MATQFCDQCGKALVAGVPCDHSGTTLGQPAPPPPPVPPGYAAAPPPQPQYAPPQYAPGQYAPAYAPPTGGTNGFAVASLVLGILWIYWLGSVLAVIFGHVALSQINQRNQSGRGLAVAGLVLGWIGVGILVAFFLVGAIFASSV